MQTKLMELRPDRSLLNSNFDGYKLSLAETPTFSQQLKTPVDKVLPNASQYSLLDAKLFGLHNHLTGECYEDQESVYFVDKSWKIQKFFIDPLINQLSNVTLWEIPSKDDRKPGDYNVSLKFASDKFAVVADGRGFLYLLDREDRKNNATWTVAFSGEVIGPDQKYVIVDVVHKPVDKEELHVLLLSINQKEGSEHKISTLHWITLVNSDTWNQVALRQLVTEGYIQYSYLETSCQAVYVGSDAGCKFTLDSENEIRETQDVEPKPKYTWAQTRDDITLRFTIPENGTKSLIKVATQTANIEVKYVEETLLGGSLWQQIDSDLTHWTLENGVLEVVLHKLENGLMWPEVVEGDNFGENVVEESAVEEGRKSLAALTSENEVCPSTGTTFNSQQVEECDFECDKLTNFERLCCKFHSATHKINLGSHHILLTVQLDRELPAAIGVRSDVDTCIWQPTKDPEDFHMKHKGTLLAMGYVQASKQQRKFFICSPDMAYSVISESTRHLFIYCQNKSVSTGELRNRLTGQRVNTIAQQQVINLPTNDEILGIYASNSYLYVLGESFLTALKLSN